MLRTFFITDGTKYHDGDVEEVFGMVVTTLTKYQVVVAIKKLEGQYKNHVALFKAAGITYVPLDWKGDTNTIGVKMYDMS